MAIRQTRIFVPNAVPYDSENWVETLMGRVIRPLVESNSRLEWFWFSRYHLPRGVDDGDCDISGIPADFEKDGHLRSLRFRYQIPDKNQRAFEEEGKRMIVAERCVISDWRDHDLLKDLGGDRFVGQVQDVDRRAERANLVVSYLHSVSKLVLHALVGPDQDGRFRMENNNDSQNPLGSSFESMHHLFCNITAVPLRVRIFTDGSQQSIGTGQPAGPNWRLVQDIPIRY